MDAKMHRDRLGKVIETFNNFMGCSFNVSIDAIHIRYIEAWSTNEFPEVVDIKTSPRVTNDTAPEYKMIKSFENVLQDTLIPETNREEKTKIGAIHLETDEEGNETYIFSKLVRME